jgi:hypothetical protein
MCSDMRISLDNFYYNILINSIVILIIAVSTKLDHYRIGERNFLQTLTKLIVKCCILNAEKITHRFSEK